MRPACQYPSSVNCPVCASVDLHTWLRCLSRCEWIVWFVQLYLILSVSSCCLVNWLRNVYLFFCFWLHWERFKIPKCVSQYFHGNLKFWRDCVVCVSLLDLFYRRLFDVAYLKIFWQLRQYKTNIFLILRGRSEQQPVINNNTK